MDAGVGAFVLANSLTAEFSLRKSSLYGSLKACIPVLILAFIRLVTVKSVEYQEHASEYGVHWNFFFTLGCMPVLGLLGKELVGVSNLWVLGVAMAVGYQVVLSGTDLQEYILTAKRVDLLSMNREGIFSLVGYAAIYYLGISLGAQLMKRKNLPDWYRTVVNFMALDVLLWILLFVLEHFGIEVSRRMVLALSSLSLSLGFLAHNFFFSCAGQSSLCDLGLRVQYSRDCRVFVLRPRRRVFQDGSPLRGHQQKPAGHILAGKRFLSCSKFYQP